ncbi:hypothetical protein [Paludifilum halophilum]|uniref:Uncharacterized protein n=1 Tax=Paludifilum halophilum TaxID=1642702 RepID=A0A235B9I6_9BACL|nr:hypothetical protein [Paludifilum halophilum]OYD08926.1 hypothetical protein CHM34_03870 [Paludifilum halophilum]
MSDQHHNNMQYQSMNHPQMQRSAMNQPQMQQPGSNDLFDIISRVLNTALDTVRDSMARSGGVGGVSPNQRANAAPRSSQTSALKAIEDKIRNEMDRKIKAKL